MEDTVSLCVKSFGVSKACRLEALYGYRISTALAPGFECSIHPTLPPSDM